MRNRDRAEAKVRRILQAWRWTDEVAERYGKRTLSARKRCSCQWCGNPRRHYGQRTREERIATDRYVEMVEEMDWWVC